MIETKGAVVIRVAEPDDIAGLARLEAAAEAQLQEALGGVLLPPPQPSGDGSELFIFVAGHPAVGFARVDELDGRAHFEQLPCIRWQAGEYACPGPGPAAPRAYEVEPGPGAPGHWIRVRREI